MTETKNIKPLTLFDIAEKLETAEKREQTKKKLNVLQTLCASIYKEYRENFLKFRQFKKLRYEDRTFLFLETLKDSLILFKINSNLIYNAIGNAIGWSKFKQYLVSEGEDDTPSLQAYEKSFIKKAILIRTLSNSVVSECSISFFQETHVTNENYFPLEKNEDLVFSFLKISYDFFENKNQTDKRLPDTILKYMFFSSLFYAFFYTHKERDGFFLRFALNKEKFEEIKKHFEDTFYSEEGGRKKIDIKDFMFFTNSNYSKLSLCYVDDNDNEVDSNKYKKNGKSPQKVFNEVYERNKKGKTIFYEPFTFYLSQSLSKIRQIADTGWINLNREEYKKKEKLFLQHIYDYMYDYLEKVKEFYNKEEAFFYDIYEIQEKYINNLQQMLIFKNGHNEIQKKHTKINDYFKKFIKNNINNNETKNDVSNCQIESDNVLSLLQKLIN